LDTLCTQGCENIDFIVIEYMCYSLLQGFSNHSVPNFCFWFCNTAFGIIGFFIWWGFWPDCV